MYTWKVWQNNRVVGYVQSQSGWDAYLRANKQFGQFVVVERIVLPQDQRSTFSG
jgi:hypothetical protein